MEAGMTIVLVVLIVCVTILFGTYMEYCNENEIGMFQNPNYENRIRELEKKVEELKKE